MITGDFNARIGEMIKDILFNKMGKEKFLPFIEINELRILNIDNHKGIMTYDSKLGKSIIDYVIVNKNWNEQVIEIKMDIHNYKFCSDHKPIMIT